MKWFMEDKRVFIDANGEEFTDEFSEETFLRWIKSEGLTEKI